MEMEIVILILVLMMYVMDIIIHRHVKFWKGKQQDASPIFFLDDVTYMYLKANRLHFVGTTKSNVSYIYSGSLMMELLFRLTKVFKDYCGVLTEESIRKNFILLYELLDEVLDFGYAQGTSTETLKAFVFNEPNTVKPKGVMGGIRSRVKLSDMNPKTTPSTSVDKLIAFSRNSKKSGKSKQRNEIFVDIFERISVTFNANVCCLYLSCFVFSVFLTFCC